VIAVDPGLTTVTYTAKPGTHVVVGAPASAAGAADVVASASAGACAVTVTPHSGGGSGIDAQPLAITVDASCAVTADPPRAPAVADAGGSAGSDDDPPGAASAGGGCGCASTGATPLADGIVPALLVLVVAGFRRRST
jgi:MYXO-CTERM domain-containing protein